MSIIDALELDELRHEHAEYKAQAIDARNELARHHESFQEISDLLDAFFTDDVDYSGPNAVEVLKKIRNIVG